jgi:hypothetical protein
VAGTESSAAGAAVPAPPTVKVAFCQETAQTGDPGLRAALRETVDSLQRRGLATAMTDPKDEQQACLHLFEGGSSEQATADVGVQLTSAVSGARVRIAFESADVHIVIFGRKFNGALEEQRFEALEGSEVRLLTAIAGFLAYTKIGELGGDSDATTPEREDRRRAALDALAKADDSALYDQAPKTAALIKQMRGLLMFGGDCQANSALDLLRAAASLVPYSADASTLVALARLREAYQPDPCLRAAEADLLTGIRLNPWAVNAADNLGTLYELAANARPVNSARQIAVDLDDPSVEQVWSKGAPPAPVALEVGAALNLSAASAGGVAPGGRLEVARGRDGRGFGPRVGVTVPWARQIDFGDPVHPAARVGWTRVIFDVGARYRRRFWSTYAEVGAGVLLGSVVAWGEGFDSDRTASKFCAGGMGTLRFGRRFGRVAAWGALSGSVFNATSVDLAAGGTTHTAALPRFDLTAMGGVSFFSWRGR